MLFRRRILSGRNLRRLIQLIAFTAFCVLFIRTDYNGTDTISGAVNILFRIDPLVAAAVMLAEKTFIFLLVPALILVVLTLVFGRFFCGWLCPLGFLLDVAHHVITPAIQLSRRTGIRLRSLKYLLLVFILSGAFFGLPVVGYFDPFSILVRGLTVSVYPAFNDATTRFFTMTYQQAPPWVNTVTEPIYSLLKQTLLPFGQSYFKFAVISFLILVSVFLLELLERRFFCRNICPLGALLAVLSKHSLLKPMTGDDACGNCRICSRICRMDAVAEDRSISMASCNLCLDCSTACPGRIISFTKFTRKSPVTISGSVDGLPVSRRAFLGTVTAGILLQGVLRVRAGSIRPDPYLIRPPGAHPEPEFLARCVRCGECMKVCIGNALHPVFLKAGMEGMFSPVLIPRIGYCEFNCTLCGQVCPTGAIQALSLPEKHTTVIGTAVIDRNRCLPYTTGTPCIVCEEHCPTHDKAIKFRLENTFNSNGESVTVQRPYVIESLCIGCGICETKCPVGGDAAIRVIAAGESRASGDDEFSTPISGPYP